MKAPKMKTGKAKMAAMPKGDMPKGKKAGMAMPKASMSPPMATAKRELKKGM